MEHNTLMHFADAFTSAFKRYILSAAVPLKKSNPWSVCCWNHTQKRKCGEFRL